MISTYQQQPTIQVSGRIITGWPDILKLLPSIDAEARPLMVECYAAVDEAELVKNLAGSTSALVISTRTLYLPEDRIKEMTARFVTEDVLFGYFSNVELIGYFDPEKLAAAREAILSAKNPVFVYGPGASLLSEDGLLMYADMPRWEIQQRMRANKAPGLGLTAADIPFAAQYKRGLFNDWRVLDRHKCTLYDRVDFWLDTVIPDQPKLIDRNTFFEAMDRAVSSPFRVVPFFDPAPWGGQWMKEQFGLEASKQNYGWGFDCVPEENSLLLEAEGEVFEMPAINVVYTRSKDLLGEQVEARFGAEFPIRFDFLDTVDGGNLSLQVHPTTEYAKNAFGLQYTQDESYYIMHAEPDGEVYLGFKDDIQPQEVIGNLERAQAGEMVFNPDQYINRFPAQKHDHFLIPAGTIHCSGRNTVVLEISATPNLFTFKLWDWQRLGLDGKPRPINIQRGKQVLDWKKDRKFTEEHLVNRVSLVEEGDGWTVEKTGLHTTQFIETYRHTFSVPVTHHTGGSVNVLNLVDGCEVIVESPTGEFSPVVIHYAETFIVPAAVGAYRIRPYGASIGDTCMTMKAIVRT